VTSLYIHVQTLEAALRALHRSSSLGSRIYFAMDAIQNVIILNQSIMLM